MASYIAVDDAFNWAKQQNKTLKEIVREMENTPRHGDRIATYVEHKVYRATIFSTAGTVNSIFLEKRIFDPVKSFWERTGEMPPELIRLIYLKMQEISSTKLALAEEEALNRD